MNTQIENKIEFTRINNDVNGNPRYVCHFLNLLTDAERGYSYTNSVTNDSQLHSLKLSLNEKYAIAVKRANKLGGRKFHNKQYGGGIVFQSYNIADTERRIIELINASN